MPTANRDVMHLLVTYLKVLEHGKQGGAEGAAREPRCRGGGGGGVGHVGEKSLERGGDALLERADRRQEGLERHHLSALTHAEVGRDSTVRGGGGLRDLDVTMMLPVNATHPMGM